MRKLVAILISLSLSLSLSLPAYSCEFAKDIVKEQDGSYKYTRNCHVEVGKRVQELKLRQEQVKDLQKAITLKDLTIVTANQRADLWMETAKNMEKTVKTLEKRRDRDRVIWFFIGVAVTGLAVHGAGQLR